MPDLKNKNQLADAAQTLAASYELVHRGSTLFIPLDWATLSPEPLPALQDTIWVPMKREDKLELAIKKAGILFAGDGELRNFEFMLAQLSQSHRGFVPGILVKTQQGLKMLSSQGLLIDSPGLFTPNYVKPVLNEDEADKEFVFKTISDWVGGDEDAESLLSHLATVLAPHYSAVKYVVLIGEGRNGKSLLLLMLARLFGEENVSSVSRQMMAERSPTCVELNNKLVNIIFDGEMNYIKDSSMEKTLIAGETGVVRMLYESGTTKVQTNALFIEALNKEPKTRDKSPALQKRLARFKFNNVYEKDTSFEKQMLSEPMLGALLSLLIDRYVREEEISERLALTARSLDLQLEQVWMGNPILQYLEFLSTSPTDLDKIIKGKMPTATFMASFKPWAQQQGVSDRSDADVMDMMRGSFFLDTVMVRRNGHATRERMITGLKPETQRIIDQLKGVPNGNSGVRSIGTSAQEADDGAAGAAPEEGERADGA